MDSTKAEKDAKKVVEEDTRIPCKYGSKCFQKNPDHHKRYMHPPYNKTNSENDSNSKKRKSPDNEESSSKETPKNKKQTISPDSTKVVEEKKETRKIEKIEAPKDEKTETPMVEKTETSKLEKTETTKVEKTETPKDENTETPKNENTGTPKVENTETSKVENTETSTVEKNDVEPYAEAKKLIYKIFLVTMPNDFYKFYDFCNELKPSDPSTAFKIADIKLVGPYDVLNGLITKNTPDQGDLVIHCRYYYDPPEFQTVLRGNDKEGLHFGYWRDRPGSEPVFVATNCSNVSHKIKPIGENLFGAVTNYLEEKAKKANPFEKTGYFNLLGKLKAYAKKYNITLEAQTPKMKSREKTVVARTIHGAGIVCPYNKKTQLGYRELSVTDNQLLKIVKKINDAKNDDDRANSRAELEEVVRLATIAGDECDFGTCLELGHDLLSTGCVHVQNAALAVLSIAYNQLDRQAFLKIVEAHMQNRKKGCNTSLLKSGSPRDCTNLF